MQASPASAENFDASLSFAHWFYVELAFRFPKTVVDLRELRRYAGGQSLDVQSGGIDDEVVEPARPDGLGSLSPALDSLRPL